MGVGDHSLPWLLLLLAVVDLAGAQELTQYLVWDEDGEEEVEDTVTSSLFEAVDNDRDTEKPGREGKKKTSAKTNKKKKVGKRSKKAKKSKGRKRKSTDSSSTSLESEQDSSSSSSSVT